MQITREDLNPCTVRLTVVCDPETVKAGFGKATKQLAKQVRMPGFRPGHAPRHLVEQYLDKNAVLESAMEIVVGNGFKDAVKEQELNLDPTVRPQIEVTKLEQDACEFTAKVGLPPIVELGDYSNLPVERPTIAVTDEDVDRQIEEIRKRKGTRQAITHRGVEEGDVAVVNIRPDGEEGDGRNFMTMAGQTFPSLDETLKGMKVEEVKHVELAFPDTFQEKDWAGKTMQAIVSLNSVSSTALPELDDAFAQSLKSEGLDDLRAKVRTGMERAVTDQVESVVSEQLLDALLERSKVEVSDNMWEHIADQRIGDLVEELRKAGRTLEDYVKENGMTIEEQREAWRHMAHTQVKRAIVVGEIYKTEKMTISNDELNEELASMARESGTTPREMLAMIEQSKSLEELKFRAISTKVRRLLSSRAEVKELAGAARA